MTTKHFDFDLKQNTTALSRLLAKRIFSIPCCTTSASSWHRQTLDEIVLRNQTTYLSQTFVFPFGFRAVVSSITLRFTVFLRICGSGLSFPTKHAFRDCASKLGWKRCRKSARRLSAVTLAFTTLDLRQARIKMEDNPQGIVACCFLAMPSLSAPHALGNLYCGILVLHDQI